MEARVVGGCAAWFVGSALFSCGVGPSRSSVVEPTVGPTEVVPWTPAISASPSAGLLPEPVSAVDDAEPVPASSRVVFVTLDGVRWQDVLVGAGDTSDGTMMPNLERLVRERGVALGGPDCPHDVRASGPNFVSLPGYLEMFTGKPSNCTHNGCAPVDTSTVVDEARAAASEAEDVAVFASWGKYARAVARGRKTIVLSAGTRAPPMALARADANFRALLEAGARAAGYPGWGDYRPDVHTARLALHFLEAKAPRLLVVGLGDADEHAHRGDVAGYRRAVRRSDNFLDELDRTLARMGKRGRETAVVITTDHGRAHSLRAHGAGFPESQRVFVAAFGAGVARRGVTCADVPLRLADIAGALRTLLALESDVESGPLAGEIVAAERPQVE